MIVTIVKQKLYTQPTIILLLNLVITDLVLLVFVIPVIIVTGIAGEHIFGDSDNVRCQTCITGSMGHAFSLMSVYNITFMSFDRFLFIYRPMKYERWVTSCRTVVVITVACFFLILVSMTPTLGFGNVIFYPPLVSCVIDMTVQHDYYPVLLFVVSFLPVPFLLLSNACVIYIVQKNIRAILCVQEGKRRHRQEHIRQRFLQDNEEKATAEAGAYGTSVWLPVLLQRDHVGAYCHSVFSLRSSCQRIGHSLSFHGHSSSAVHVPSIAPPLGGDCCDKGCPPPAQETTVLLHANKS